MKRKTSLYMRIAGNGLRAVPGAHFRYAFAQEVHQVCSDPATRPNAVAVELDPKSAAAVRRFMRDLGISSGKRRKRLPCMFALLKNGRHRHPVVDLNDGLAGELPPGLLKRSPPGPVGALFLSPTDSIVEAVRCALELGLPLYGVDLEDAEAERERSTPTPQDPAAAMGSVPAYVQRNAGYAAGGRDEVVDGRRERAMAAHLRYVLKRHKKVLFVCGLAHWKNIEKLLEDRALATEPVREAGDVEVNPDHFTRVVVHPSIAIRYMDFYPAFVQAVERRRTPAFRSTPNSPLDLDEVESRLRRALRKTYREYFGKRPEDQLDPRHQDLANKGNFEQLLVHLCAVKLRRVPDLVTILETAHATMSREFSEALARTLMKFEWASPKSEGPPVLRPALRQGGGHMRCELVTRDGRRRSREFTLDSPAGGSEVPVPVPYEWADEPPPRMGGCSLTGKRTWPPGDLLTTALTIHAANLSETMGRKKRAEEFTGTLEDGLAIKPILRAASRGEDRIYVWDHRPRRRKRAAEEAVDFMPVVWIFGEENRGASWGVYGWHLSACKKFVRDPERLEQVRRKKGGEFVAGISYGAREEYHRGITKQILKGVSFYIPPHFLTDQEGRWMEHTDYRCTPFYGGGGFFSLAGMFQERYGFDPRNGPWPVSLVRMAVPYAHSRVTVIAPDGFRLPSVVFQEARRRRVDVNVVPLSCFPREQLQKVRTKYLVPMADQDMSVYPQDAERVLGEPITTHRHLVPKHILHFGRTA